MDTSGRYAPPKAPVDIVAVPAAPPRRPPFPWLLVLRYTAGAYVTINGLVGLHGLSQSWATLTDRAFIDPNLAPHR